MAEPAVAAWDALRAAPLYLKDVNSWLLLAVSVGFAVGALCDGLSSDDIYPGYGRCARRAQQAREDYLDQLQEVRETLEDMKNEALEDFEEQLRHVQSSIGRYEGIMADKQSTALKLNGAIANADNCLDALLKTFRDANAVERADRARPPYFDLPPNLPKLTVPDVDTARDEAALARQRALAAGLIDQAPSIKASIQASFSTQYDMLKPIDEHFATMRVVDEKEPSLAQAA
jgi:inorganic triphosphatase YgiF